jgi:hypothetical protein
MSIESSRPGLENFPRPELPLAELIAGNKGVDRQQPWPVLSLVQTAAQLHDCFRWGNPDLGDELESYLVESSAGRRAEELLDEVADAVWSLTRPEADPPSVLPVSYPGHAELLRSQAFEQLLIAATYLHDFVRSSDVDLAAQLEAYLTEMRSGQSAETILEDVMEAVQLFARPAPGAVS